MLGGKAFGRSRGGWDLGLVLVLVLEGLCWMMKGKEKGGLENEMVGWSGIKIERKKGALKRKSHSGL